MPARARREARRARLPRGDEPRLARRARIPVFSLPFPIGAV